MEQKAITEPALRSVVAALSSELGWNLRPADVQRYAETLTYFLAESASEAEVRRICAYYHQDHEFMAALSDHSHTLHSQVWKEWTQLALQTLYKFGLAEIGDLSVAAEDLAQAALVEIFRSLHSFRYQSRLKTWAYRVVVRTAQRLFRDSRAQKRARNLPSLNQFPDLDAPVVDAHLPETEVHTAMLINVACQVLMCSGDKRLVQIFCLSVVYDRSTEEIAQIVHLHPSRVRALLAEARTLLRKHPALHAWWFDVDTPAS